MDALVALVGTIVLLLTVSDIFQSVIVPRPVSFVRPSAYVARFGWRVAARLCTRIANAERRENLLGTFAPALLITFLVMWVSMLVLGFGAIFYALRSQLHPEPTNFWAATYYAGTSVLTLGYGDFTAATGFARALSLMGAALGLGTFAVVVAFLFSLVGAYQKRETFLVALRERTGAPPSGVGFLTTHAQLRMLEALPATFHEAELWVADVMETHLAFPILVYFRSTHDEQSWIGTLGALLDASSLILTTIDVESAGPAKLFNLVGRHLVNDFADYFEFAGDPDPGIERGEFHTAYERLREAGLPLRDEGGAWTRFAALRATYAGPLNAFAAYFRIPPAQWIGDRSILRRPHHAAAPPVFTAKVTGVDAPPESA